MSSGSGTARFAIGHWNRRGPVALLLVPLAWLYGAGAALRRLAHRSGLRRAVRLPVPVIVVGNFVAGGTGKTPLTIALVNALRAAGHRPGVVSRGHGGTERGPAQVPADGDAERFGDEPVLIARRGGCPVFIGRDRARAGLALLAARPEVDVIVCDDGLQHLGLARDVEIAVFDARGVGNGLLLPAGPLRERPRPVDALVRNGAAAGPGEHPLRVGFERCYALDDPSGEIGLPGLRTLRLHAAAGIGAPQRFFDMLEALDLRFTPHAFPDHHPFRVADLAFAGADRVLITEKDAVKCKSFPPGDVRDRIVVVAVGARLDSALHHLVTDRIRGFTPP